jgi:DNA (cytosine-5)-methyltransferase 1
MKVAGLFAGIGGIELGLDRAGHETEVVCEIDDSAYSVLRERFSEVRIERDVRDLSSLPKVDLVAAGFPCQDLSQAGLTAGISGQQSGLVQHVFRLIGQGRTGPQWLLLENVPFMLQLDRGNAMRYLTRNLEDLGFAWAYRVVDTRAFGLPHRRQRVLLLASRSDDPRPILFEQDAGQPNDPPHGGLANGFYWTEGLRGLGWAVDAVPTLKGGSTVGIPSPPAIWLPTGEIVKPDLRDAERLQGFVPEWTRAAAGGPRGEAARWKLVGNAVSVPVAAWIGERLAADAASHASAADAVLQPGSPWPRAAWGSPTDKPHLVDISAWPVRSRRRHLADFLRFEPTLLSKRACSGFLERARRSSLRFPHGLLEAIERHATKLDG